MSGGPTDIAFLARAAALAMGCSLDDLAGPPRCLAGCGAPVERLATNCPGCETLRVEADRVEALRRAWGTVPKLLSWVRLCDTSVSEKLAQWAPDVAARNRVVRIAQDIALDVAAHPVVTFVGEFGAGKTTLACGLLREYIRRGSTRHASHRDITVARRARYASTTDLLYDQSVSRLGEHVPSIDLAHSASVLLLDEAGRGRDLPGIVFGILHARHRDGRQTILTTPYPDAAALAAATGDGGMARRVYDDATVVHVLRAGAACEVTGCGTHGGKT